MFEWNVISLQLFQVKWQHSIVHLEIQYQLWDPENQQNSNRTNAIWINDWCKSIRVVFVFIRSLSLSLLVRSLKCVRMCLCKCLLLVILCCLSARIKSFPYWMCPLTWSHTMELILNAFFCRQPTTTTEHGIVHTFFNASIENRLCAFFFIRSCFIHNALFSRMNAIPIAIAIALQCHLFKCIVFGAKFRILPRLFILWLSIFSTFGIVRANERREHCY